MGTSIPFETPKKGNWANVIEEIIKYQFSDDPYQSFSHIFENMSKSLYKGRGTETSVPATTINNTQNFLKTASESGFTSAVRYLDIPEAEESSELYDEIELYDRIAEAIVGDRVTADHELLVSALRYGMLQLLGFKYDNAVKKLEALTILDSFRKLLKSFLKEYPSNKISRLIRDATLEYTPSLSDVRDIENELNRFTFKQLRSCDLSDMEKIPDPAKKTEAIYTIPDIQEKYALQLLDAEYKQNVKTNTIETTFCSSESKKEMQRCSRFRRHDKRIVVDWITYNNNTSIKLADSRPNRKVSIRSGVSELLALSLCAYIVDECSSRSKGKGSWSRSFKITIPTHKRSTFEEFYINSNNILQFVSGDYYEFKQVTCTRMPSFEIAEPAMKDCDAICLFSGGIDSLAGAISLLEDGQNLCLVSHYSDALTSYTHKQLSKELIRKYPGQIDYRPCYVQRKKIIKRVPTFTLPNKADSSHRVRSILFLALAAIHAELYSVDRIYIPENGIIGLNVPLDSSRSGAFSTRTTHPSLLVEMSQILSGLSKSETLIINPFLARSKTEIVALIPSQLHNLLRKTHSCAKYSTVRWQGHPWTGRYAIRHCGYCLPCIYRRLALLKVDKDRKGDYLIDIFNELDSREHKETRDFRALVSFLLRYDSASKKEKYSLLMSNGHIPLLKIEKLYGYRKEDLVGMYDRFSEETLDTLRELCSSKTRQLLGI